MSDELRIPCDPERMRFHKNSMASALRKWRHYAMCVLGMKTLAELEKRDLVIIPKGMLLDMLKQYDKEAYDIIRAGATQKDLPGE